MAKKKEGFFDCVLKGVALKMAVEASRDENGKPDPYKATGMAMGVGYTSMKDVAMLGAMLDHEGAFDEDEPSGYSDYDDDDGWRDDCEDGWEYGLYPEDYETEEDYMEALEEAKYGWREACEDGWEYGLYPEDYETEEEYNEALEAAKHGWRETCIDNDCDVDSEEYETEEEYEEAVEEAECSWRDNCEDGWEYGLDPEDYETEEEYSEALEDAKREKAQSYAWREKVPDGGKYGIDPRDYATEEEYMDAYEYRQKSERREEEQKAQQTVAVREVETQEDESIYTYCGVSFGHSTHPYSYRTEDTTIKVGDTVIVPVGENEDEVKGKIVFVGQYAGGAVPYPVEKTKFVIRKD